MFVDKYECKELNDSLNSQIATQDKRAESNKKMVNSFEKQLSLQTSIISEKDKIIGNYREVFDKQQSKIRFLKLQRNVLAIVALVLSGIIIF